MRRQTVFATLMVLLLWAIMGLIIWFDTGTLVIGAIALGAFSFAAWVFFYDMVGGEAQR